MSRFIVEGGSSLCGKLRVDGSKNAVLPILAATILNGRKNMIKNYPKLKDVDIMLNILRRIGCSVKIEGDAITVDSSNVNSTVIPEELASEMRSSIIFMGPMLAKFGKVTISYPGGCAIVLALL